VKELEEVQLTSRSTQTGASVFDFNLNRKKVDIFEEGSKAIDQIKYFSRCGSEYRYEPFYRNFNS
ncbi:unnamed protein product, partial [Brachionus calyciflorus]